MEEIRRIQDIVDIFLNDEVDWIEDAEALANVQPPILPHLPLTPLPELPKEDESNPLITPPPSTPIQYCIIYLPEFKKFKNLNYFFVFNPVGRGEGVGVRRTELAVFSP